MSTLLIKNGKIVNEGKIFEGEILIQNGIISKMADRISITERHETVDAKGKYILPGVIDDQVHFREPGLTAKGTIRSESRAAVAGGTTSYMEMPNTVPNALNQSLLEDKYVIAENSSLANYSFFMGASNDNYEEVMKTDIRSVCGLKIFMGSSTGNMLVDKESTLTQLFANFPSLIATHCEDEKTIKDNLARYQSLYKDKKTPFDIHAMIRTEEACYKSSAMAVSLAKRHDTRLHILHISSSDEIELFDNTIPLEQKRITAEVCIHHMWFDAEDYKTLGTQIKCNPAIKHGHNNKLFDAMLANKFDVIATDHAPHQWLEKDQEYWDAPSGLPLVQHGLTAMLAYYKKGKISLQRIVEKMAHAPSICFQIEKRGFIREGYWADLVLVDLDKPYKVTKENTYYQCGWSPFEGQEFPSSITDTIVSGHLAYSNGKFREDKMGQRLRFER